jgi:hypothetical protein
MLLTGDRHLKKSKQAMFNFFISHQHGCTMLALFNLKPTLQLFLYDLFL